MDPFIEATVGLWGDFHDKLVGDIERELSARVPDHYSVRLNARSYVVVEEDPSKFHMRPDVSIERRHAAKAELAASEGTGTVGTATISTPVIMHAPVEIEYRETFIEVYGGRPERNLVTGIEVLSPSNKRPGTPGWDEYFRKRSTFLNGAANFVEIDLLRGGRRMPMQEAWPASPYYVLVSRRRAAPECRVWPAHALSPLPDIPIPLERGDADIVIGLQSLIEAVYHRTHYGDDLDYSSRAGISLSPEEVAHLEAVLPTGKSRSEQS
jgi:hypothetical protein